MIRAFPMQFSHYIFKPYVCLVQRTLKRGYDRGGHWPLLYGLPEDDLLKEPQRMCPSAEITDHYRKKAVWQGATLHHSPPTCRPLLRLLDAQMCRIRTRRGQTPHDVRPPLGCHVLVEYTICECRSWESFDKRGEAHVLQVRLRNPRSAARKP